MNGITSINEYIPAVPVQQSHAEPTPGATRSASATVGVDEASFSELGQLLSQAGDDSGIRADRVADVRAALERDEEQFVRERLDQTVQRIQAELSGP